MESYLVRLEAVLRKRVAVLSLSCLVEEFETTKSLEEMVFETSRSTLDSVGLTASQVDGFVLAGQDEIDGRVISIMMGNGPAGGVNKDSTLTASSSEHALIYGYLRLLAGQGNNVLVMGWAKPSESLDPDRAELMSAEPFLLRQIGMNHTIAAALQASKWAAKGVDHSNTENFISWPLSKDDLPKRGDSVYALLLAVEGSFPEGSELAWVVDAGWATMSYELGARDLTDLGPLKIALEQISKRSPQADKENWNAVEIAGDSEFVVRAVERELDLSKKVEINASGSLADIPTSPFVAPLARMWHAVNRVSQLPKESSIVAGIGFNGFAGQGASVMVFSGKKEI